MSGQSTCIVVLGLGSAHGDDQFGWQVVEALSRLKVNAEIHKIRHPVDILAWLDSAKQVHLVDACRGLPNDCNVQRLEFAVAADRQRIEQIPTVGTHDMGLYATLMLAKELGRKTDHVTLWAGHAEQFKPMDAMSDATQVAVQECLARVTMSLRPSNAKEIESDSS